MYEGDKGHWMQPICTVGRENASNFFIVRFRLSEKIQKRVVTGERQKRKIEKSNRTQQIKTVTGGGGSNPKSDRNVIYGRPLLW